MENILSNFTNERPAGKQKPSTGNLQAQQLRPTNKPKVPWTEHDEGAAGNAEGAGNVQIV